MIKRIKILFLNCLLGFCLNAQDEIYTITEVQAEFPGGISEMMKFVQTNLKYPESARNKLIGGKVFLKFVVNETGEINNVEILKGSGNDEIDEEAVRVVKLMPKWSPANMTGKPVKCYFNLPLSFSLAEPFYVFNLGNKNEQYRKVTRMIFDGKSDEAYAILYKMNDENDVDLMYNKAVLLFNSKKRSEACEKFKSVLKIADAKTSVYTNSNRFYKEYCN